MRRVDGHPGFALLLVLLVLVICGTALLAAARWSAQNALAAGRAQSELQLRWGRASCRGTVLPVAERLLADEARRQERPVVQVRAAVQLGGMTFQMVLSDESAKANVNLLAVDRDVEELTGALRRLQTGAEALSVRPRPFEDAPAERGEMPMLYTSFDQVYADAHPAALLGDLSGDGPSVAARVTCWGAGPVNIRRADPAVLAEVFAADMTASQLGELLEFRREQESFTVAKAFAQLGLTKRQIDRLTPRVTDTPDCYGLWVVAAVDGQDRHALYVYWAGNKRNIAERWTFAW